MQQQQKIVNIDNIEKQLLTVMWTENANFFLSLLLVDVFNWFSMLNFSTNKDITSLSIHARGFNEAWKFLYGTKKFPIETKGLL